MLPAAKMQSVKNDVSTGVVKVLKSMTTEQMTIVSRSERYAEAKTAGRTAPAPSATVPASTAVMTAKTRATAATTPASLPTRYAVRETGRVSTR